MKTTSKEERAQEAGWVRRPDQDYECLSMSGPTYGKYVKREIWEKEGKRVCTEDLESVLESQNAEDPRRG